MGGSVLRFPLSFETHGGELCCQGELTFAASACCPGAAVFVDLARVCCVLDIHWHPGSSLSVHGLFPSSLPWRQILLAILAPKSSLEPCTQSPCTVSPVHSVGAPVSIHLFSLGFFECPVSSAHSVTPMPYPSHAVSWLFLEAAALPFDPDLPSEQ